MSYSSFVSMIRGIKIDDWNKFYDSLWEFSANHDSDLIGEFIKTYYKDYPVRDWLVEWTC